MRRTATGPELRPDRRAAPKWSHSAWWGLAALVLVLAACGQPASAPPAIRAAGAASARPLTRPVQREPLPPGALRRYGSYRLRHRLANQLAFVGDFLVSAHVRQIRVWDPDSGERVTSFPGTNVFAGSPVASRFAAATGRSVGVYDVHSGSEKARVELDASVRAIVFSADGARLAASDAQGHLVVFDADGQVLHSVEGPGAEAVIALDDGGRTLAAALGTELTLWRDGKRLHDIVSDKETTALAFTADGTALIASAAYRTPLYDVATGALLLHLGGEGYSHPVAVSRAGLIAIGGDQGQVSLYGKDGRGIAVWNSGRERAKALTFNADGSRLAASMWPGVIRSYDVTRRRDATPAEAHQGEVRKVAVSADGRWLVSADAAGYVCLWNRRDGALLHRLRTRWGAADALALSPDSKLLAFGDRRGWLSIHNIETGRAIHTTKLIGALRDLSWAPDGALLAAATSEEDIWLLDAPSLTLRARLRHGGEVSGVAISPDGASIASAGADGYLELWDRQSLLPRASLRISEHPLDYVRWSPDGTRLAIGWWDRVQLRDARSGMELLHVEGVGWDTSQPAWSRDGGLLAVAGTHDELFLLETSSGKFHARLAGHQATPQAFAFSPDGSELISGSDDTTLLAWPLASLPAATSETPELEALRVADPNLRAAAAPLPTHDNHRPACPASGNDGDGAPLPHCAIARAGTRRWRLADGIATLAWSPDGRWLAAGGENERSIVFDTRSGRAARELWHESSGSAALTFSPDSDHLASASTMDGIRVWDVASGALTNFVAAGWLHADSVRFSADGQRLLVAKDKLLTVHDLGSPQDSFVSDIGRTIRKLSLSRDGRRALLVDADGAGVFVSLRDGRPLGSALSGVMEATLIDDDAIVGIDHDLRLVSGRAAAPVVSNVAFTEQPSALYVSGDGSTAAVADDAGVSIFDTRPPRRRRQLTIDAFDALSLSDDGRALAVASDAAVEVWDTVSGQRRQHADGHLGPVKQTRFDAAGNLVTAARDVRVWDPATGALAQHFVLGASDISLSQDGSVAVYHDADGVHRWQRHGDQRRPLALQGGAACSQRALSGDGRVYACDLYGHGVQRFDASTGSKRGPVLARGDSLPHALALSPDGGSVAIASEGELLLAPARGKVVTAAVESVTGVTFSPDGKRLFAFGSDDTVRIFDAGQLRLIAALETRETPVGVVPSPDGTRLVVAMFWGNLEIWDLERFVLRHRLKASAGSGTLAYSQDGRRLASGAEDTSALIYDATRF